MPDSYQRPLFYAEHLHRLGRRLKVGAGRGMISVSDPKLQQIVSRWLETHGPDATAAGTGGRSGKRRRTVHLTAEQVNTAADWLEERPAEIATAHIALFLHVILRTIEDAVLEQFVQEVVHGQPGFRKPQVPAAIIGKYFTAARRLIGIRPGRYRDADAWSLLAEYSRLRDELRRAGVRAHGSEACEQLARKYRIEPEAMQQQLKRARAKAKRFDRDSQRASGKPR